MAKTVNDDKENYHHMITVFEGFIYTEIKEYIWLIFLAFSYTSRIW